LFAANTYFYRKNMDYSILLKSSFFKGLAPDDIEIIFASIPFRIKKFQSGTMISQNGEPVNSFIMVIDGIVKGEMVDYSGRVIKIEDIPAPGAIAPAFMFGNKNRFPVNVIAVSDVELLLIGKKDFLALLMRNDLLLVNFLDMISNRSQFLSEKIKFLNFKTIRGKLAQYILNKSGEESNSVSLGMTQNELSDFFGVARPSLARAIGDLEKEGYIEARGRNIKIVDKEGLADLTVD
jgi:CRP/FNR family transcriptional regulator, dissimilatory nitrate respiration regulator